MDAGEVDEPEEVFDVVFPPRDEPAEVVHPGEDLSLTIVLYGKDKAVSDREIADFATVFTDAIALKVKQEFATKAKAKLPQKVETKPLAKAKKAA